MIYALVYWIAVSLASYGLMRRDKRLSLRRGRRIPERRLFACAAIGGAVGVWLGMYAFRHKTKHFSFVFGIPAFVLWNAACAWVIVTYRLL